MDNHLCTKHCGSLRACPLSHPCGSRGERKALREPTTDVVTVKNALVRTQTHAHIYNDAKTAAADTIWAKPVYDEVMEGTIQEKGMGISQFQKFNIK